LLGALTLKVVLAGVLFVIWTGSGGGSASHSYIAKWAKNRTEKWRFGAEFWKFLGELRLVGEGGELRLIAASLRD
jgi:hypothetical protein